VSGRFTDAMVVANTEHHSGSTEGDAIFLEETSIAFLVCSWQRQS